MIKVVCSVFDAKAGLYSNPFYSVNVAVATRDFNHACTDPNSGLAQHPEDFSLYVVANFDDESGLFVPNVPPLFVANAVNTSINFGEKNS
jgi:hypothetical protein